MSGQPVAAGTRFLIRAVKEADIPAIAVLERESFPGDPWPETVLRQAAEHESTVFLAVFADTSLAGYCVLRTVLDEGSIDNICVAEPYRRQGAARMLLAEAMHRAREAHGAETYTLEVRVSNTAARALYESLGFVSEGVRPSYYERPREDAVICRAYGMTQTKGADGETV